MTVYIHKNITTIAHGGHSHSQDDKPTQKTKHPRTGEKVVVETVKDASERTWAFSCIPECEQKTLDTIEFSGHFPVEVPLTPDEERAAAEDARRSNVEVATLSRALAEVAREKVASGV